MIRIKFIQDEEEKKQYPLHLYSCLDFKWLVEGSPCEEVEEPPFRDADSLKVLREVADAEFVKGDWFGIDFRYEGRSCITAVKECVQHALVAVANSRKGIYTSLEWYPEKGWEVLADLSMDILLYLEVWKISPIYPLLDIPDSVYGKILIENHRYENRRVDGMLIRDMGGDKLSEAGGVLISNYFDQYCFDWREHLDLLIQKAEQVLKKKGDWYRHKPVISDVSDFASALKPDFAKGFYECLMICPPEASASRNCRIVRSSLKDLQIHNYLYGIPTESVERYPMYLVMTKDTETGACTVSMKGGVKYPTFSEAMTEDFVMPEGGGGTCVTLTVVIDAGMFYHRENSFENAVWAFKYYDNIMELYDNIRIYDEFVRFIKQPFEDGLVTVMG